MNPPPLCVFCTLVHIPVSSIQNTKGFLNVWVIGAEAEDHLQLNIIVVGNLIFVFFA